METRKKEAIKTIRENDRGGFTVPTKRLYPYQWNWDSGFTALGIWHFDKWRAWMELFALMDSQWPDGMVPHIVFRRNDPDYFPGPSVWNTKTEPATSGHSQPPILASVVLQMAQRGSGYDLRKAAELFPRLMAYHRWFARARDPQSTGVISIIHPWESGRDNCPDWDSGMAAVCVSDDLMHYQRRDTTHVNADHRPTQEQYDKFISIIQFARKVDWEPLAIYTDGPFLMADPGVQFTFLRAARDLLTLADMLGMTDSKTEIQEWIDRAIAGSEWLWNDRLGGYCARDIRTGQFSDAITNASMLCFYAGVGSVEQRAQMLDHCRRIMASCKYCMPSWDPAHADFEPKRYWRGPVWAVMNHMISKGLSETGEEVLAQRIVKDTCQLVEKNGLAEYFDPLDGTGLGGKDFSWTAAIYLDLRQAQDAEFLQINGYEGN